MGKNKKKSSQSADASTTNLSAEALKDLGNQEFQSKNYALAIKHYTSAIAADSKLQPSHIYFSNRANALLETQEYDLCISDCDQAILILPSFVKAYYRKCKALIALERLDEALVTVNLALDLDALSGTHQELLTLKIYLT